MIILKNAVTIDATQWIEPIKGLKLLIGSIENEQYRATSATIYRHFDRIDAKQSVGTNDFDISAIDINQTPDELLMNAVAYHLIKDWQGVGELNVDGKEVAIKYSPDHGISLLKQQPELYWKIINAAILVGKEEAEQVDESVKKP
ncbi:hypothetical protein M2263_001812 [Providencia alcalifaciens]|nr:hypothetical protein [Providencia alcalifaciens]